MKTAAERAQDVVNKGQFSTSGDKRAAKTLIISGQEDILFPPDAAASIAKAIPGAIFSMIEHAAHSIHMEQPQMFTDGVLDFLLSHP